MKSKKDGKESVHNRRDLFKNSMFADLPEFNFRGNREVIIEGSRGVLEYSENVIRINTNMGLVCFEGRNLNLKCISVSELIIDGFITKVEFVV